MQQPELIELFAGSDVLGVNAIPILQTKVTTKSRESSCGQKASVAGDLEETLSPFSFTPQRVLYTKYHEFFEDGDIHRHLYLQDLAMSAEDDPRTPKVSAFRCHITGCNQLFDTLEGYEHHYNSLHRNVCSTCKRSFPSNHLLDIHILEWHDSLFQVMAEKQCMYQCLVEGCGSKFKTREERKEHLISTHTYPADFRFDKSKRTKRTKERRLEPQREISMEISAAAGSQRGEPDPCESMDFTENQEPGNTEPTASEQIKPRYSYRVPSSVCFGQGSVRGFRGARRKK
ncbi:zinc finger protein 511 [Chanos chanos]|uniref:Zinc finger protein 511 n=1 Tax=Chanos chanos TaxID=29144 RepID=A0A6J2V8X8_CHACN|nr:zinc finger protein 511 [Chanos chanos]